MGNSVYFRNLNGLRFIAALMVIIHHIEQYLFLFGAKNFWQLKPIKMFGRLGVVLFFVLSGFLITYLLLEEKKQFNTISIKDFYLRRVFRIWPLYYLVVLSGLFVLPLFDFFSLPALHYPNWNDYVLKSGLFIFFMPNLALAMFPPVLYIAQAWSIGVEEQFYIIWPILIRKFNSIGVVLITVITFILVVKFGLTFLKWSYGSRTIIVLSSFWNNFNFDCMAVGGLAAYLLHIQHRALNVLYSRAVQYIVYGSVITLILLGVDMPYVNFTFYSVLFAVIILNLAGNHNSIVNLEVQSLNYLGKISYGLYMFHPLVIILSLKYIPMTLENRYLTYAFCILASVLIAILSYELFERKILALKLKHTKLKSG